MTKADSRHTTNPSTRCVDVRASQVEPMNVSTRAPERHAGALKALTRLREETVRQLSKLSVKGYRKNADCDADAAGQSSGIPRRSRRQVMVLMSSAAVLAIETGEGSGAAVDVTIAPAVPGDSAQLQALLDRYLEKKSIYLDLRRRKDELKKVELSMIPDHHRPFAAARPTSACSRKLKVSDRRRSRSENLTPLRSWEFS